MSKLTESFRALHVFNPHNFYAGQPYIAYTSITGRGHNFSGWRVHLEGKDLGDHWTDHNAKSFSTYKHRGSVAERRAAALAEAQAWAAARFGISEWAKDPYGGWGDAGFVKQRVAYLRQRALDRSVVDALTGSPGVVQKGERT